jgi:fatty-acyl-CoA synthase
MTDNLTLGHIVRRNAVQHPHRTAFIFEDRQYTYREYNLRVNRTAHVLERLGIAFGDHVALLGHNSIEYFEVYHAASKLGAVFCTLNWRLTGSELTFIIDDNDAKILVVEAGFQDQVAKILPSLGAVCAVVVFGGPVTLDGALCYEELTQDASEAEVEVEVSSEDAAVIMYTSGTTGLPKGAVLTHGGVCWDAVSYLTYMQPAPPASFLLAMPMNHIAGLHIQASGFLVRALPIVILRQWSPEAACRLIQKHRITNATILVTPLQQLMQFDRLHEYDLTSLRVVLTAAAKYKTSFAADVMNRLSLDRLLFAYGLTEASALVSITEFSGQMLVKENTMGFPVWYCDIKIVDDAGNPVEDGTPGELLVRGPNVFKGYYKRPEANADTLRGGWLHTGDVVVREEGFLYFTDRVKDMIKSGGFNVYSLEVELAMTKANPQLEEVSVIGVPDDQWGEAVTAFAVIAGGQQTTADEIIARTRDVLAGYKVPKTVHLVQSLPKNVSGKVRKTELRKTFDESQREQLAGAK